MPTFAERERSSIQLVEPPSVLDGRNEDRYLAFPGIFFSFKEKLDENFEYKNKELFYSIYIKKNEYKNTPFLSPRLQYLPTCLDNRKTHLHVLSSLFYS